MDSKRFLHFLNFSANLCALLFSAVKAVCIRLLRAVNGPSVRKSILDL
jgi:hypothetical protein